MAFQARYAYFDQCCPNLSYATEYLGAEYWFLMPCEIDGGVRGRNFPSFVVSAVWRIFFASRNRSFAPGRRSPACGFPARPVEPKGQAGDFAKTSPLFGVRKVAGSGKRTLVLSSSGRKDAEESVQDPSPDWQCFGQECALIRDLKEENLAGRI
jgi:hypothetical protein